MSNINGNQIQNGDYFEYLTKSYQVKEKRNKKLRCKIKNRILVINNIFLSFSIIILNLFKSILSINKFNSIGLNSSEIKILIKEKGYSDVFCSRTCDFEPKYYPDEIYINGIKQDYINSSYYFNETNNIIKLIWNKTLENSKFMFYNCSNITEIDLSNFDSSLANDMRYMFKNCTSLISINLTNFNTSNAQIMLDMFSYCSSLTSLNLSSFNTSKVKSMVRMFSYSSSLISLDLSNFDTSQVMEMYHMFSFCSSLTSLDLSKFNFLKVKDISYMFSGCILLEYINLSNFYTYDQSITHNNIFDKIQSNIVLCINQNYVSFLSYFLSSNCYTVDCSNNWKQKRKKMIAETSECIDNCNNSQQYIYEYNGKCYDNCKNGYINNNAECKCELEKCLTCLPLALSKGLCTKCNKDYYPKENDILNIGEYFNCYKDPEGYYLDKNDSLYKECYFTCKSCEIKGNNTIHKCISCNDNYSKEIKFNNYSNCYKNCNYYYYLDNDNNYHCTLNLSCPNEYPKLNMDQMKCIKDENISIYKSSEIFNDEYTISEPVIIGNTNNYNTEININIMETQNYSKYINLTDILKNIIKNYKNDNNINFKLNETKYYETILDTIEKGFTSQYYDTINIDNGNDEIMEIDKIKVTLTSTQNLMNNINNNNMTIIKLEQCETLLKKIYNISNNDILYMKKIDIIQEGMKIPKIEYDIYYKLNGTNLVKLNVSICKNTTISLSIPIIITENLDKFNTSSKYYNDKCYSSKSDSGTDIILKDRKNEFIEGNKTVCQEYCDFSFYDQDNKKVNCSCDFRESSLSFDDMKINTTNIYDKLGDLNEKADISNIGVTSCNVLSSKENIESNAGFYSLLLILVIFVIIFIIFYIKGYNLLENKIDEVIYKKFEKNDENKKSKIKKTKIKKSKIQKIKGDKHNNKKQTKKSSSKNMFLNNNKINKKESSSIMSKFNSEEKKLEIPKISNIKPDSDYEFNWLSYEEALKCDKRSNCEYYCSLIRTKQLFIFTFCSFNDYNSGIIKKLMFFLSFALHYTVNALFFNESNIHQIYIDEGQFNFDYQISFILYSAIISNIILRLMLHFLILTDKDILEVKLQSKKDLAYNMKKQKLKYMKIKFALFFVLNFILLVLFWYYLTCFNAVYQNTQIYLIENTFISFGLSLFYPFIINIIPTIIRNYSIHSKNKNKRFFYKVSQYIQVI